MRTRDDLERWRNFGFVMTPSDPETKAPITKDGKHFFDWTDDQLEIARRLAFYQRESGVYTVDFDDPDQVAHGYISMLPDTFTDGKVADWCDAVMATHKTYKINGAGPVKFKYPPDAKGKKDGLLVETLYSTNTIFEGEGRIIINDVSPAETNVDELEKKLKLICFFTEVQKLYDVGDGARDDFHLKFTGCLARLDEQEYPTDLLDMFHEQFLINVNDTTEIKKRLKIARQRKNLEAAKNVYGIKDLASYFNVKSIPAYDLLKPEEDAAVDTQEAMEESDPKEYPLISGDVFDTIDYPKVDYIMEPIFTTRSFNQIYGYYESGKTVFGLALSIAMASGQEFLDWKCETSVPTLYVESELPAELFKKVRSSILMQYYDVNNPQNNTFKGDRHFTLTQDDLTNNGFKYGFKSIAVAKEHGKKAAEDYGRRGREFIESLLYRIEKQTGQKPFYFLDNMSRLATFDENKAPDWHPFINWGIDLKNKGYSGCFVHHANKGNGSKGSSGSSFIGRLLDTSIQLTKLENDYRFEMSGDKNLQSSIEFDKSRGFGGSKWTRKRIVTMNEDGEWSNYPFLKQISFEILKLHNQGLSQEEIRQMANDKQVRDANDNDYSASSVDRLYLELVKEGLIEKKRETRCWSCKQPISTDEDGSCEKCKTGIPCSNCGKCICEKPKKKK
ncbi:AAA family ATPase [Candidatus Pelagibacter sp.]|nr:AAA family ATPase [Candidatus Pelagibacter sp.]